MGFDRIPFITGLIEVIEEGHKTPSVWDRDGIDSVKNTSEWLKKKLPSIAKKVFRKHGIQISIT
jgi:hypothetical protein